MDVDFLWRAEMACRAAWPAEQETDIGGWTARRSGGLIRRVNSLNQMPASQPLEDRLIDQAEAYYARFDQPALVRVQSFTGCSADALAERGYQKNGATTTLCAGINPTRHAPEPDVTVSQDPTGDWLTARNRIAVSDPAIFRSMLDLIEGPKLFAGGIVDGAVQSVAYGVVVDGLLVIESVATDKAHRGRGLARKTVQFLMNWAAGRGGSQAVLQVVTDNEPARALYRSLGFDAELFGYFYMRQPLA